MEDFQFIYKQIKKFIKIFFWFPHLAKASNHHNIRSHCYIGKLLYFNF
jgi:hypothetical protein